MAKPKPIDEVIARTADLSERLSPVSAEVADFTPRRYREHLRTLTEIVGELAIEIKRGFHAKNDEK